MAGLLPDSVGMLAPERRSAILGLVRRNKSVLVKELCEKFAVTGETIRKDLSIMEQDGLLIKTYGGAYVREGVKNEVYASLRETLFTDAKNAIGKACGDLIQSGDTIFLDESTTCLAIARHILAIEDLTVITNSLKIAEVYGSQGAGKLLVAGGELDRKNQCFVGACTLALMGTYYADRSFVSCRGLSLTAGVTDGSAEGGTIRRLMLEHGTKRYLVLDRTKLDLVNFFQICDFSLLHAVVIDRLPDENWRSFLQERDIEVIETMGEGTFS